MARRQAHGIVFTLNLLAGDESSAQGSADIEQLRDFCQASLEQQQLLDFNGVDHIEISVQMLDTEAMRVLNAQYRDKDAPTNVLSFESGLPILHDDHSGSLQVLGELIFCPSVVAAEASEQDKPLSAHWAHLMVHGTLHLCGYDHIDAGEALCMETLEIAILSKAGIANPYLSCGLND